VSEGEPQKGDHDGGDDAAPIALLLRTTVIQAFARTVVDESRKPPDAAGSEQDLRSTDRGVRPVSEVPLPSVGNIVGGAYKLTKLLGQGMFGKVYVAERVDVPEHRVALKLLPRSVYQGRNVERELVMLATVGHPHVVQLKDHGTTADYVWLTMPVYQGETLAERLERGPLELRDAYEIFTAVAQGLEALHNAGLRHQDVKPENIFLARFGRSVHPILLDLGVAAEKDGVFVAGTALYAAPEQIMSLNGYPGAIPLSEKMDTYCLATTLLKAIVGSDRFPGEKAGSREEIGKAQELRASLPLPGDALLEVHGEPRDKLDQAFAKWLALEPEDRPTMAQLGEQLDVLLEPEREIAREEQRRQDRQKRSLGRLKLVATVLFLGACATAGLLVWKRQTLTLAGQLEAARSESAESFDKLDTCVASHRIATMNAQSCRQDREHDQSDFKRTLEQVAKSDDKEGAERAKQVQASQARLRQCEDRIEVAQKTCTEEESRMTVDATRERAQLVSQRDEAKALADIRALDLQAAEQAKNECQSERAACVSERDALKAAPPHPGRAVPSSIPSAGPPVSTGAPTAPWPPPPPAENSPYEPSAP
jgi:serine/threonine protein kinase